MRETVQLGYIKQMLTEYPDDIPLHFFLKDFYRKHPQFGSRDRKFYSELIYKYFRCKTLFEKLPFEEKLCYSGFLTSITPIPFYRYLITLQNDALPLLENWHLTREEKIKLLSSAGKISWLRYFPSNPLIDRELDVEGFLKSHLKQPKFYIRVNQKWTQQTEKKLREQNIEFEQSNDTFSFKATLDMAKLLPENSYEVQDLSSQKTISLMAFEGNENIWDCCAGAGGKSLMILDKYPEIKLFCSDNRATIISNLKVRFAKNNIKPQGVDVYDVVKKNSALTFNGNTLSESFFDVIIADVPCSGSGTWGRTPERLSQFKEEEIERYGNLQKSIVKNVLPFLKVGGKLIYITCSVYASENTENIKLMERLGLVVSSKNYFVGYDTGADTLFGMVLKKIF